MPLASAVTTYLFNPPSYAGNPGMGGDVLTASGGGLILTPTVHVPTAGEVGAILYTGGVGGIIVGYYTVQSLSGGGYVVDRSAGANGATSANWVIGGNLPFPSLFSGSGAGLTVTGIHSTTEGNDFSNVSDPGCIRISADTGASPGNGYVCEAETNPTNPLTWELLGVPAGKFAVKITGRCRAKVVTVLGTVTDVFLNVGLVFPAAVAPYGSFIFETVPKDAGWDTYGEREFCIPEDKSDSTTAVKLLITVTGSISNTSRVEIFLDTLEVTTYYDDQWCDYCTQMAISPTSVTLVTGQSQAFTTNLNADFSIVEGGDSGSLSNIGDQSVTYTAGNTPGVYHLLAEDQCVAGNDATATITVIAAGEDAFLQVKLKGYNSGDSIASGDYGLPTNFLVQNPQENIVYILEKPAVDLNNFFAKKLGMVQLLRNGGASQDTTDDPIGFVALELQYEVS